jgi:hypothetical protein
VARSSLFAASTARVAVALLVSAWSGLALGLGLLTSRLPDGETAEVSAPSARRSWTVSFTASGFDPCVDELTAVAAELTVEISVLPEGGSATTNVDLDLRPAPGTGPRDAFMPLTRRFAGYWTPISRVPFVHTLRTPLAAPYGQLDLAVDLEGSVDDREHVGFRLVEARLDGQRSPCAAPPVGPPPQPMTLRGTTPPSA